MTKTTYYIAEKDDPIDEDLIYSLRDGTDINAPHAHDTPENAWEIYQKSCQNFKNPILREIIITIKDSNE